MYNKDQMNDTVRTIVEAIVLCYYSQKYQDNGTVCYYFHDFVKKFKQIVLERSQDYWIDEYAQSFRRDPYDLFECLDFDLYDEAHSVIDDDELDHAFCEYVRVMAEEIAADPMKTVKMAYGDRGCIDLLIDFITDNGYSLHEGELYGENAMQEAQAYEKKYINLLKGLIQ